MPVTFRLALSLTRRLWLVEHKYLSRAGLSAKLMHKLRRRKEITYLKASCPCIYEGQVLRLCSCCVSFLWPFSRLFSSFFRVETPTANENQCLISFLGSEPKEQKGG